MDERLNGIGYCDDLSCRRVSGTVDTEDKIITLIDEITAELILPQKERQAL